MGDILLVFDFVQGIVVWFEGFESEHEVLAADLHVDFEGVGFEGLAVAEEVEVGVVDVDVEQGFGGGGGGVVEGLLLDEDGEELHEEQDVVGGGVEVLDEFFAGGLLFCDAG